MSARTVLDTARTAGFRVESRGGKLHVEPTPPPDLIEQLRQRKAESSSYWPPLPRPLSPAPGLIGATWSLWSRISPPKAGDLNGSAGRSA